MKLKSIRFKNYKAYGDTEQNLELRPLTVIFGKNNSGKSAAVRLPILILAGIACEDGNVLPTSAAGVSYGQSFLDLVHGSTFFIRPEFDIKAVCENGFLEFKVCLFSRGLLSDDAPPEIWSYAMKEPTEKTISAPESSGRTSGFLGLLPPETRFDKLRDIARNQIANSVIIGPTRSRVAPVYARQAVTELGINGEGAPNILAHDTSIAEGVGEWFSKSFEGWRLSVKREGDSFSLRVAKSQTMNTNLAQAGEGLQQVLPIVTHLFQRAKQEPSDYIDVIEQPELHLHAAAQAPLGDLFVESAKQSGITLVETNSQSILLRLQRRVAEGTLLPEHVALYFVDTNESSSNLRRIAIDINGELDWWPRGVFEEDFVDLKALRRAQQRKSSSP